MSKINKFYLGNENLYLLLKKSYLNKSLSHANIIAGPKGIGKSTFIHYFISKLYNVFEENNESDNISNLIYNYSHPNFIYVNKIIDDKTNKIKNFITVEQIRNLSSFIYKSSIDKLPKIILIDDSDQLNINAANSLLKLLEEPRKNTYFFLISHNISNLIPTIRSRCIKFNLIKPNYEDFSKILLSKDDSLSEKDISFLFDISNHSPGLALNLFSNNIHDHYLNIIELFKNNSLNLKLIDFSNQISKQTNDQYLNFLTLIKFILINLIKIYLGINLKDNFISDLPKSLDNLLSTINIYQCIKMYEYIEKNQKDLFTFNLDKKIFTQNLFQHKNY